MKRLALRKIDLIIYCICILAALASLVAVSMFPVCWNVPGVTITEANAPRLGACIRNMLNAMLLIITVTMTTLLVCQTKDCNAPSFLLPALLLLFLVLVIVTIVRTRIIGRNS